METVTCQIVFGGRKSRWRRDGGVNDCEFRFCVHHGWVLVVGAVGMFHIKLVMIKMIQWPGGEFTLQTAVDLNTGVPQGEIRKKLADGIAAKTIVQTQKGDGKIKGKFQVVKTSDSTKVQ